MFKMIRIFILLLILAALVLGGWRERTRSVEWKHTLPVTLFLINAENSPVTAEYVKGLTLFDFKPVETFMQDEAVRYGHPSRASIDIRMGGIVTSLPPSPPQNGNVVEIMLWSLKMRWWAYRNGDTDVHGTQVKLFLLYFDPEKNKRLAHSTGLQKGLLGRINLYASTEMASQNNVVIAHEFLHTLGASDKYDFASNQPIYPDGYAIPEQLPLFPQSFAEIMAGRTPVSQGAAEMPNDLSQVLIGYKTAQEINFQ
jgi:hypothetical protein